MNKRLKHLVAISQLKVNRYFNHSDKRIAKLYKSKYVEEKVKNLYPWISGLKKEKMYRTTRWWSSRR